MKIVFASYVATNTCNQPQKWLEQIQAYTGILSALAVNNQVISIEQIDYEGDYVKDNVNYKFRRFNPAIKYFPLQLNRFIKELQPDVVFIHSLHFPIQVMLLRRLLGAKTKIIIQNHAERPFNGIKKHVLLFSERYVNAYLFASKAMGLDWIAAGNLKSPGKIHGVMEISSVFYPIDKARAKAKIKTGYNPVFLWVGRLNPNKDPITVIKAFLKFAAVNPAAGLYMIYHTEELLPQIKELLSNEPNAAAITLIGKVPNADLLYWYNSAGFIIAGSHHEGGGTAVCEALSCGCIPVITDIFSFRMITDNGRIGRLYPAGNEPALLTALIQTQQMDLQTERAKALAYFKSTLSFEAIAQKIQDLAASL